MINFEKENVKFLTVGLRNGQKDARKMLRKSQRRYGEKIEKEGWTAQRNRLKEKKSNRANITNLSTGKWKQSIQGQLPCPEESTAGSM